MVTPSAVPTSRASTPCGGQYAGIGLIAQGDLSVGHPAGTAVPDLLVEVVDTDQQAVADTAQAKVTGEILLEIIGGGLSVPPGDVTGEVIAVDDVVEVVVVAVRPGGAVGENGLGDPLLAELVAGLGLGREGRVGDGQRITGVAALVVLLEEVGVVEGERTAAIQEKHRGVGRLALPELGVDQEGQTLVRVDPQAGGKVERTGETGVLEVVLALVGGVDAQENRLAQGGVDVGGQAVQVIGAGHVAELSAPLLVRLLGHDVDESAVADQVAAEERS